MPLELILISPFVPTPGETASTCALIQSEWSEGERMRRLRGPLGTKLSRQTKPCRQRREASGVARVLSH